MSMVKEQLAEELRYLATRAVKYQNYITHAKTKTKKIYFERKLRLNNTYAAHVVEALDRILKTTATTLPPSKQELYAAVDTSFDQAFPTSTPDTSTPDLVKTEIDNEC
jgi:hypothetical protein